MNQQQTKPNYISQVVFDEYEYLRKFYPEGADIFQRIITDLRAQEAWFSVFRHIAKKENIGIGSPAFYYHEIEQRQEGLRTFECTTRTITDKNDLITYIANKGAGKIISRKIAKTIIRHTILHKIYIQKYNFFQQDKKHLEALEKATRAYIKAFNGFFGEHEESKSCRHEPHRKHCEAAHINRENFDNYQPKLRTVTQPIEQRFFNPITNQLKRIIEEGNESLDIRAHSTPVKTLRGKPQAKELANNLSCIFKSYLDEWLDETVALFVSIVTGENYSEQAAIKVRPNPKSENKNLG